MPTPSRQWIKKKQARSNVRKSLLVESIAKDPTLMPEDNHTGFTTIEYSPEPSPEPASPAPAAMGQSMISIVEELIASAVRPMEQRFVNAEGKISRRVDRIERIERIEARDSHVAEAAIKPVVDRLTALETRSLQLTPALVDVINNAVAARTASLVDRIEGYEARDAHVAEAAIKPLLDRLTALETKSTNGITNNVNFIASPSMGQHTASTAALTRSL
ncbi:uncharacterized protein EHS24_007568 [Apiotrichum porosum]|uniref:Uncharacterized protein n=1 Tax=Apiotrichum porosum TaxID=105984 RepID=A0A427XUQ2_9TREE|nr:uncharacterized protein EHS24_007568 [Apiotrichum porosum]RSH82584.1 hypothetical protein EHS24_007568 [Apiotrichum porosum]